MVSNRNLRPVMITSWGESKVLNVGEMEIWDGADLCLLRETMARLVEEEECCSLGVDMTHVKYIPSGFFGMLCSWYEKGVCIRILDPMPNVRLMLWFTRFFHHIGNDCFEMCPRFEDDAGERFTEPIGSQEPVVVEEAASPTDQSRMLSAPSTAMGRTDLSATEAVLSQ